MGTHPNIDFDRFPKQGQYLHQYVRVLFHYDTREPLHGIIVRDDTESPGHTLIKLNDGRYVLASECQYSPSFEPVESPVLPLVWTFVGDGCWHAPTVGGQYRLESLGKTNDLDRYSLQKTTWGKNEPAQLGSRAGLQELAQTQHAAAVLNLIRAERL